MRIPWMVKNQQRISGRVNHIDLVPTLMELMGKPGETTNLFDSGRHKEVIRQLTKKIHQWQESVQDTIAVG